MDMIEINHVKKKFRLYYDKNTTLKEKMLFRRRNNYELKEVLSDVTIHVAKGQAIGLIGENGSGKSTLLKLLSRILYPDEGTIEVRGRVSSLIELGAGFHPDMSGRENIFNNASVFGLTHREIEERLEEIIDFSELGEFIDNPVRTYSSGMYMRLAFAVAINVDADVLLIDEILAVGDASFQAKCFNKLREIKNKGTTIVIVSHSLGQIEQICDQSYWIRDGKVHMSGLPRDVHPAYMDYMGRKSDEYQAMMAAKAAQKQTQAEAQRSETKASSDTQTPTEGEAVPESEQNKSEQQPQNETPQPEKRWGNRDVEILSVRLYNRDQKEAQTFMTGEEMRICIAYKAKRHLEDVQAGIGIFRNDNLNCYGSNTGLDHLDGFSMDGEGTIECRLPENNLLTGEYSLDVALHARNGFAYDYIRQAAAFRMFNDNDDVGTTRLKHVWQQHRGNPETEKAKA